MRVAAALGGNAFVRAGEALSVEGEHRFAREALAVLAPFFAPGTELLVVHGNGPQVGHQLERAERARATAYLLPLDVCVAQTQGELGYVLAQALSALVAEAGRSRPVVALVTRVEIDAGDAAFRRPTKPVGPVLDRAAAAALTSRGAVVHDDAGRGLRRVVPSPEPVRVVEEAAVRALLESGAIVVAAGGGGIPVAAAGGPGASRGVEAVVDKDLTAALLAGALEAELLVFLTDVPCAYTDHLGPRQARIGRIDSSRARALLAEGQFAPGSMGPKIEAAVRFVEGGDRRSIVCDPPSLAAALRGDAGTIVVPA
jgi:carbamate kinase